MWSQEINKNMIWGLIVAVLVVASPFIYQRAMDYLYPQPHLVATTTSALPTTTYPSATLADIRSLALTLTKEGKLLLTWEQLSGDVYKVLIYRSPKNKSDWQLWKTVVVTGYNGSKEIVIPADLAQNLYKYNYFFAAENVGGSNIGVSTINVFDVNNPMPDGAINTTSTGIAAPYSPGTGLIAPTPSTTTTQTTNTPNQNIPPSTTTTVITNPNGNGSTTTIPTVQYNYVYSPNGQIVGIINFPAVDQNFWVTYPDAGQNQLRVGWQNLPAQTTRIIISRSIGQSGPWTDFFLQENPETIGPYNIYLVDVGVDNSFYYRLSCFDAVGSRLATFGPVYLNAVNR